jgi:cytochrome c oxidase subunit 2
MKLIDHMPRYERIWLAIGVISIAVFLAVLAVLAIGLGFTPSTHANTIAPDQVATTAPFNDPRLEQTGPNEYRAYMVAQMFSFMPSEIRIPRGAKVTFEITSPDVVHGLLIPGTNVNMMAVPGLVTEFTYTFKKSGDYPLICHEYCGVAHQLMMGRLIVE